MKAKLVSPFNTIGLAWKIPITILNRILIHLNTTICLWDTLLVNPSNGDGYALTSNVFLSHTFLSIGQQQMTTKLNKPHPFYITKIKDINQFRRNNKRGPFTKLSRYLKKMRLLLYASCKHICPTLPYLPSNQRLLPQHSTVLSPHPLQCSSFFHPLSEIIWDALKDGNWTWRNLIKMENPHLSQCLCLPKLTTCNNK